ncbi:MAG: class I SAM-dependent methyltransferase [Acidobacteria bacterium]|nr:class I SAM-dependent methyltransferase [Acidobacteriota bacterium]
MQLIDPEIQNYSERFTSAESELLTELLEKTYSERNDKNMLSGFYQGRLLAMLSKMIAPQRILEIGTYMGYSALCLAEGLTEDGRIITLDMQPETHRVAKEFWAKSPLGEKIDGRLGDASEIIPTLDETFDMVFIDADKPNYANYFDLVFPKMRTGGLIIADNVLWSGEVLDAERGSSDDESTIALHEYNKKIQADERVSNILIAVRDGLMVSRKEHE